MKFHLLTAGERLQYIRNDILKLSKSVLKKKYGLKPDILYNWECGRVNINEKVFKKLDKLIFVPEGIMVDMQWLLEGLGNMPRKFPLAPTLGSNIGLGEVPEDIFIQKELSLFINYHSNAICVKVDTDLMLPFYSRGDYVCGKLVSGKSIENLLGYDCIIVLKSGLSLIRRIVSCNQDKTFNLVGHNLLSGMNESILLNVDIESAAEILLHRKLKKS